MIQLIKLIIKNNINNVNKVKVKVENLEIFNAKMNIFIIRTNSYNSVIR